MWFYYVDKSKLKVVDGLSKANIESALSGSIIIWDTHFGQKYSDVKQEDIQKYAGTFKNGAKARYCLMTSMYRSSYYKTIIEQEGQFGI